MQDSSKSKMQGSTCKSLFSVFDFNFDFNSLIQMNFQVKNF